MWRFRSFIGHINPVVPIVRGHFHCDVSAVGNFGCFFSWDTFELFPSFARVVTSDLLCRPSPTYVVVYRRKFRRKLQFCIHTVSYVLYVPARESSWNTGLFEMIAGVLTCHTQYTWDRSICIFLFNRTTLQVFVTYLAGALYVHPLWFYKHQHESEPSLKPSPLTCYKRFGTNSIIVSVVNCELPRCSFISRQGRCIQFPVLVS